MDPSLLSKGTLHPLYGFWISIILDHSMCNQVKQSEQKYRAFQNSQIQLSGILTG